MSIDEVKHILNTVRKHKRKAVEYPALLDIDGKLISCMACDMSLGGMRLKTDIPVEENSNVSVKIKDKINQVAKVIWAAEGFIGLNFEESPNSIRAELGALATNLN